MIEILNSTELPRAREAGALVAGILQTLKSRCEVGTNGRGPFGHYICTSVNDAVLHGLPYDYTLANGDLLTLDLAVSKGGVVADSAISFIVGDSKSSESVAMISATERALSAGISAARPGARIGDISHAIGAVLSEAGYRINTEFGGHGVGSTMHQDPHVPNIGRPGRGCRLRLGLCWHWSRGSWRTPPSSSQIPNGWTLRSATGWRTAHSEHTIAITNEGAEVLTLPKQAQPRGTGGLASSLQPPPAAHRVRQPAVLHAIDQRPRSVHLHHPAWPAIAHPGWQPGQA
jgi:methionyl aminopeptidase